MHTVVFLELVEDVGIEPSHVVDPTTDQEVENPRAGELGPLCPIGITIPVPTMAGNEIVMTTRSVTIPVTDEPLSGDYAKAEVRDGRLQSARVIPGTRTVETNAPPVVNLLLETGHYRIVEPPTATVQVRHEKHNKKQLEETARTLGVDAKGLNKTDLIAAIRAAEAAQQQPQTTDPEPAGAENTEEV